MSDARRLHCLTLGADVADALGCLHHGCDGSTMPFTSAVRCLERCLLGDDRKYHVGHRDCTLAIPTGALDDLNKLVDADTFDPRGMRHEVLQSRGEPSRFWLLWPAIHRPVNKLLLARWQRGGPTVHLKCTRLCVRPACDLDERSPVFTGVNVPLALVWPHAWEGGSSADAGSTPMQRKCLRALTCALRELVAGRLPALPPQLAVYERSVRAWEAIARDFGEDASYACAVHATSLGGGPGSAVDLAVDGYRACFALGLCRFGVMTTLLQTLLLSRCDTAEGRALLHSWQRAIDHVDGRFLGTDARYDVGRQGRMCPRELTSASWDEVFDGRWLAGTGAPMTGARGISTIERKVAT